MKKLPIILSATMLISGFSVVGMPVVWAEGSGDYSLTENVVNPMLKFSLIDAEKGEIGIIFNEEDDDNLVAKRVRFANYDFDKYTQAMVEAEIELLAERGTVKWAMSTTDYETFGGRSGKIEKSVLLTNGGRFLGHNPGVLYYMMEYMRSDTGEVLREYGKLNYRDCVQYGVPNSRELTSCNLKDVGGKWEYERVNTEVDGKIKPWSEELADYLDNRFLNLEYEPGFFPFMTDEAIVARKSELYEMIVWLREVLADADRQYEIYEHSQEVYKLIFGEEDPTENPYRNPEDGEEENEGGTEEGDGGEGEGNEGGNASEGENEDDESEGDDDAETSGGNVIGVSGSGNRGPSVSGLGGVSENGPESAVSEEDNNVKWPVILQPVASQVASNSGVASGANVGGVIAVANGNAVGEQLGDVSVADIDSSDENIRDIADFGVPVLNETEEKGKTWWGWSIVCAILGLLAGVVWWVRRAFGRDGR